MANTKTTKSKSKKAPKKEVNKKTTTASTKSSKNSSNKVEDTKKQETNNVSTKAEEVKTPKKSKQVKIRIPRGPKLYKKLAILGVLVLIGALLATNWKHIVVGRVGNRFLTSYDLYKEMKLQSGKNALETLITKELIKQEGRKQGVEVTQEDLQAELAIIEENLSLGGLTFEEAIAQQGLTVGEAYDQLRLQIILKKVVANEINVTDEEVNQFIETNNVVEEGEEVTDELKQQVKEQLTEEKTAQKAQELLIQLRQGNGAQNYLYPESAL